MKKIIFPKKLLTPIQKYLKRRESELRKKREKLEVEDPFSNPSRTLDMAANDTEANERVDHDRVAAMRREVDKGLIRIKKALTRIKVGSYGTCEQCGKMINTERLAIDPSLTICVSCEKKREKA